ASLLFLAVLAWFAATMYRQHRASLYSLGDHRRGLLYLALAVATLTLSATHRMWNSSAGSVAWLILMGSCVYAVAAIAWAARRAPRPGRCTRLPTCSWPSWPRRWW